MANLTRESGEKIGQKHELEDIVVIGRSDKNSIYINDPMSSREHSKVTKKTGGFYIEDLNSRNGTLVNGEKVKSRKLFEGDLITVGRTSFRFRESDSSGDVIPKQAQPLGPQANLDGNKPEKNPDIDSNKRKDDIKNLAEQIVKKESNPIKTKELATKEVPLTSRAMYILLSIIFFIAVLVVSKWLGELILSKMMSS